MAACKCKMCGGDLLIEAGSSVCECEYCGSKQTVPTADNDRKMTQFARANKLLRACEFDKAAGVFESIVADFPNEAEAYWGLVLCQYGIEYVDDPATGKKVPTCHRSGFDSVLKNENYEQACENTDAIARRVYRDEARAFEELRKAIIEVSGKEEPYDVFISYKETDDNGSRTEDSVIAQDIYRELTREGYRVFFSRITLESKLGTEYEPYIFAALNSAKVMLVVGTDYEHMNAVWVKNEWSRYLKLIASGQKKTLIPVYKNMDAYDMPEEFARLTAQDMGKIGAMQDLLHGVEKLIGKKHPEKHETVIVQQGGNPTVDSLLERVFIFLEDGKWNEANSYAEKVLDIDPKNAEAYLGKLMAQQRVRVRGALKDCGDPIETTDAYKKAVRFGSAELITELEGYNTYIITRNKNTAYDSAQNRMTAAKTEDEYKKAAQLFGNIPGWKDSDTKKAECLELAETARKDKIYADAADKMKSADKESAYKEAADMFGSIPGWKDADAKKAECLVLAENARKDKLYHDACVVMEKHTISDYRAAIEQFKTISGHKDSAAKIEECEQAIADLETQAEAERIAAEENKKKTKKTITIAAIVAALAAVAVAVFVFVIQPAKEYNKAVALRNSGDYAAAEEAFLAMGNYKDAAEQVLETRYLHALSLKGSDDYVKTAFEFGKLGDYKDAKEQSIALWRGIDGNIAAGYSHTVGLRSDGTVVAKGDNSSGQCDVSGWTDIIAVACGWIHTVGLRSDGTVVAVGSNKYGQCDVSDWTDIVAVAGGNHHTVGLRSDGTVVAVGRNDGRQCDVSDWSDIVAVACGFYHTVGLRSDGTVVAAGTTSSRVSDWTDIVAVSGGWERTVGLRSDGTVVAAGKNNSGECDVSGWTDIVALSSGQYHTAGLRSDGTVVAVGWEEHGQCDVSGLTDIVDIVVGAEHTVGLRSDGTVVAVGWNKEGQCNVSGWTDILITYNEQ